MSDKFYRIYYEVLAMGEDVEGEWYMITNGSFIDVDSLKDINVLLKRMKAVAVRYEAALAQDETSPAGD